MALDFPSSPTNGQVYGNWIWSSAKGAWSAKPLTDSKTITADVPPATPQDGDQWFNTIDGTLYIYVVDIDGGQWVESQAPITANGYYSPNYIINGGMDIWQRGTSFNGTGYNYGADRWLGVRYGFNSGMTVSRQSSGLTGFNYCTRIQRDSGNTLTTWMLYTTVLESSNSLALAGKTVTLSFYARAGANFSASSAQIEATIAATTGGELSAASSDGWNSNTITNKTLTTSWQRFSITTTLSSSVTQVGAYFKFTPVGTAGANDYFEVTGVQLEEGSIATTFRRNANSIQGELAACQRYYWRTSTNSPGSLYGKISTGLFTSPSNAIIPIQLPVTMRTKPTSVGINDCYLYDGFSSLQITSASLDNSGTNSIGVNFGTSGGGTQARACILSMAYSGGSSAYVELTAEL